MSLSNPDREGVASDEEVSGTEDGTEKTAVERVDKDPV
jgi:hypothetical protein